MTGGVFSLFTVLLGILRVFFMSFKRLHRSCLAWVAFWPQLRWCFLSTADGSCPLFPHLLTETCLDSWWWRIRVGRSSPTLPALLCSWRELEGLKDTENYQLRFSTAESATRFCHAARYLVWRKLDEFPRYPAQDICTCWCSNNDSTFSFAPMYTTHPL